MGVCVGLGMGTWRGGMVERGVARGGDLCVLVWVEKEMRWNEVD